MSSGDGQKGRDRAALEVQDSTPAVSLLRRQIVDGLSAKQKHLPSLYFYDERGSELFEQITELPEYYPTRTELGIMQTHVAEIARLIGPQASLIEFGSGSSLKTRILLDHLPSLAAYVPVDISDDFLQGIAHDLAADYPELEVLPVAADFTRPFPLPTPRVMPLHNLVYFPGSTIGNFDGAGARALLRTMRVIAGDHGAALIGADLRKERGVLERAYNDAQGVTAAFNLNMLVRLNREMGATFDLDEFRHEAVWNELDGCIEMHLISRRDQQVRVAGQTVRFKAGEHILTERSHKYTREEFVDLAAEAGFRVARVWTDPDELFSVQFLSTDRE